MNILNSRERCRVLLGKRGDFIYDIQQTMWKYKELNEDAFSLGQLESKHWAVEIMEDLRMVHKIDYGTVFILCGWYGILAAMMFYAHLPILKIRSFDIDPDCFKVADAINKTNYDQDWKFKGVTADIFDINFERHSWQMWSISNKRMSYKLEDSPDTIINTSCEHTNSSWFNNIPNGKLVVLQSNNFLEGNEHINCMTNLDEFKESFPLTTTYYDGKLGLPEYDRFMLIGVK